MTWNRIAIRSLDRMIVSPSNLAVWFCMSPFAFYAIIARWLGISFPSWWFAIPSLVSAALFIVVGIRTAKWANRLTRPADQARTHWERKHLGKDYQ